MYIPTSKMSTAENQALVVFVDRTECSYLRWLKRGFRHCFTAIRSDDQWIICDPLKNHLEFSIINIPSDFDLSGFYHERGHIVLTGKRHLQSRRERIVPELLTCVSIVKKIIGVRCIWALTPWQLFQALSRTQPSWKLVKRSTFQDSCDDSFSHGNIQDNFQLDITQK
jgi:hypothetical protein